MTYQEFKNKYNNKYIDYDGAFGCQCWDLGQYYFTEVLNVPDSVLSGCGWVGNMVLWDWKYAQMMEYFDEVSTIGMQQGDVCIWADPSNEKNCHIAIFDYYNPNDNNCYYFSQDPNLGTPCMVRAVNMNGHHAFRRKQAIPPAPPAPTPVITPNVERDEYKNQIEVKVEKLRVRTTPSLEGEVIGFANPGLYNYFETKEQDGYVWYRISDNNWIAYNEEWETIYPAKEKEYKQFEVLDKKDGYVLVDIGKIWIKE